MCQKSASSTSNEPSTFETCSPNSCASTKRACETWTLWVMATRTAWLLACATVTFSTTAWSAPNPKMLDLQSGFSTGGMTGRMAGQGAAGRSSMARADGVHTQGREGRDAVEGRDRNGAG